MRPAAKAPNWHRPPESQPFGHRPGWGLASDRAAIGPQSQPVRRTGPGPSWGNWHIGARRICSRQQVSDQLRGALSCRRPPPARPGPPADQRGGRCGSGSGAGQHLERGGAAGPRSGARGPQQLLQPPRPADAQQGPGVAVPLGLLLQAASGPASTAGPPRRPPPRPGPRQPASRSQPAARGDGVQFCSLFRGEGFGPLRIASSTGGPWAPELIAVRLSRCGAMPPALPPTVPVCSSGGGVVAGGEVLPGAQLQGSPMAWGDSIGCRRAVPPLRVLAVVPRADSSASPRPD
jgi:hypothetical protein